MIGLPSRATIIIAAITLVLGFVGGWQWKTTRVNSATVKQVVKAAKAEAKNEVQVERQNETDKGKVTDLEVKLAAALRTAAFRGVPKPPQQCPVSAAKADAGAGEETSAARESARRYDQAYRSFREELIIAGKVAEDLRLQVLSCEAQWPD